MIDPPIWVSCTGASDLDLAQLGDVPFGTLLADPPWRFQNRTGKVAPEHGRLSRYDTMAVEDICALPIADLVTEQAHCSLCAPHALFEDGLEVLSGWGGSPTRRCAPGARSAPTTVVRSWVGFCFRNVHRAGPLRGPRPSAHQRARSQAGELLAGRRREHYCKPDELYAVVEACSPGPYLELFAHHPRPGWVAWGHEAGARVVSGATATLRWASSAGSMFRKPARVDKF